MEWQSLKHIYQIITINSREMDSGSRECNTLNFDIKCFSVGLFVLWPARFIWNLFWFHCFGILCSVFCWCQNIVIVNGAQVDTIRSSSVVYGRVVGSWNDLCIELPIYFFPFTFSFSPDKEMLPYPTFCILCDVVHMCCFFLLPRGY